MTSRITQAKRDLKRQELAQGYTVHRKTQWYTDKKGVKRLSRFHTPEVRYVSPIASHERRQAERAVRRTSNENL